MDFLFLNLDFFISFGCGGVLWVFVAIWVHEGGSGFCCGFVVVSVNFCYGFSVG